MDGWIGSQIKEAFIKKVSLSWVLKDELGFFRSKKRKVISCRGNSMFISLEFMIQRNYSGCKMLSCYSDSLFVGANLNISTRQ